MDDLPHYDVDARVALSERLLFKESLVPAIQAQNSQFAEVGRLCKAALAQYDQLDPTLVNGGIMATVGSWCTALEYLELILDSSKGADYEDPPIISPPRSFRRSDFQWGK